VWFPGAAYVLSGALTIGSLAIVAVYARRVFVKRDAVAVEATAPR
jgi:hypothetical protein